MTTIHHEHGRTGPLWIITRDFTVRIFFRAQDAQDRCELYLPGQRVEWRVEP